MKSKYSSVKEVTKHSKNLRLPYKKIRKKNVIDELYHYKKLKCQLTIHGLLYLHLGEKHRALEREADHQSGRQI